MYLPIDCEELVITQKYHARSHKGVDLRSVNLATSEKLAILLTEDGEVLRIGVDGMGNDFMVIRPEHNELADELKYIHVTFIRPFHVGELLSGGTDLGRTQIVDEIGRGNSKAHHLHFETWKNGSPFNPTDYFDYSNIAYRMK